MRRPVPHRDLRRHADALEVLALEGVDVEAFGDRQQMQVEVDQRRGVYSSVWQPRSKFFAAISCRPAPSGSARRSCMPRELAQHLRLLEPVLVELRGQLDPIGQHAGAGRQSDRLRRTASHAARGPFRGTACGRPRTTAASAAAALGKVHHVEHDRPHIAREFLLVAQRGHPGAAVLGRPREIIAVEYADMTAAARPSPPRRARRDARPALDRVERQAEQPARRRTPPRSCWSSWKYGLISASSRSQRALRSFSA